MQIFGQIFGYVFGQGGDQCVYFGSGDVVYFVQQVIDLYFDWVDFDLWVKKVGGVDYLFCKDVVGLVYFLIGGCCVDKD